ncbi:hypothetical protein ACEPAI_8706 [Sanghuangporus weigelae]
MSRNKRRIVVDIFDTWLSRTNGSPISFMFLCSLDDLDDVEDHRRTEYMVKTLLSQQHRWKDVKFASFNVKCSDEFPGLDMTNMPILTLLSLHVEFPVRAAINRGSPRALKASIRLVISIYQSLGSRFQISLDVLKNAPFLTKFDVDFSSNLALSNRHDHHPRFLLLSLRALKLEYREAPAAIVDNLTLPPLEAFYYASSVKEGILFNFFRRSRSPLTFLALCDSCAGEDEILGILRLLPCLKALRYSNSIVSKRFFRELAVGIEEIEENALSLERPICPKLDILCLHNLLPIDSVSGCVGSLVTMTRSRARIQKSFENIRLELDSTNFVEINISDIEKYTEALEQCFEDKKGHLIVGDYESAFRNSFPPNSD